MLSPTRGQDAETHPYRLTAARTIEPKTDHDLLITLAERLTNVVEGTERRQSEIMREIGVISGTVQTLDGKMDTINGTVAKHQLQINRFANVPFSGDEATKLADQTRVMWFWFGILKFAAPPAFVVVLTAAGGIIKSTWF